MRKTIFLQEPRAQWLKGNLHCHSVFSDGTMTPQELRDAYRQHGYDFLALTDHNVYVDTRALSGESFTMLQGVEVNAFTHTEKPIHINFLWANPCDSLPDGTRFSVPDGAQTQELCRTMRDQGAYVMLNHPHWSWLEPSDVAPDACYHGVEIYNYSTEWLENMGDGSVFWTQLLHRGDRFWNGGSDDNHNRYEMDSLYCDSFGGFTVVKAADRSAAAIIEAMKAGSFYTSTGPSLFDFYVEDDTAHVVCSPCTRIYITGDQHQYQYAMGCHLTEHTFRLRGTEKFVRAEVKDAAGRSAYSNPIYLD